MDHIIREAANNHHPAYNDKAWEKMEMKLDKHLPQKTDRRRWIFFLLFFVLLGAGILFTLNKLSTGKNAIAEKNTVGEKNTLSEKNTTNGNGKGVLTADKSSAINVKDGNDSPVLQNAAEQDAAVNIKTATSKTTGILTRNRLHAESQSNQPYLSNNRRFSKKYHGRIRVTVANPDMYQDVESESESVLNSKKKPIAGKTAGKQSVSISNAVAEEDNDNLASAAGIVKIEKVDSSTAGNVVSKVNEPASKKIAKEDQQKKELTKKAEDKTAASADKKKSKNKFGSNFGITASIGPDVSFVKLNNTGKTTLTYGAGLSYDFVKRFTARAGFYISKKVYEATPDQYNPPGGNYPYLTGVDANCRVYEIPVSLAYNFGQHKNHNWFGNVGLSSFIMKKEDYTYNYKTPAGQTYMYYQEVNNKNKHYFAVLTLSAGYKYQLTKRLSIQAEPYAKIPLGGVGQGKIKLNSAGVLFTATYKPFKKKH